MPLSAIGTAVTAVTGSSFGAKNGDYVSRSHICGSKFSMILGIILTLIFVIFATSLATIFAYTADTSVLIPEIVNFLQMATLCLPLTGVGMASSYFYQGIGQGTISLIWTIIREIICTNCLIYLFGIFFSWGLTGIWLGLAVGRALAGALNFVYDRYTIKRIRLEFNN